MKKLLYITDQSEYIDHSFIGPLFETYLKKHIVVDIVYFTEFKSDFEKKDEHRFIVPTRYKDSLIDELDRNGVEIAAYSYIFVRNDIQILKHVLKKQDGYEYKLGFRLSFPKRRAQLKADIANNKVNYLEQITAKFTNSSESNAINKCDIFLPTSDSMHEEFFPEVDIVKFVCPPGIDPNQLHDNLHHEGNEKRFIYVGTLDKVREFEVVLEAFSKIKSDKWSLTISTKDPIYALKMVQKYNDLEKNVEIQNAKTKSELLKLIANADVGVALLPDIPIYNTSTPIKVLDYYSSAVPSIITNAKHINTLFTDSHDAWFCKFTQEDITKKLESIIELSKDEVADIGARGQSRLLEIRNYEKIADELAIELEKL
jgi:glycosyltransferase involved in cell wall biosynthesis